MALTNKRESILAFEKLAQKQGGAFFLRDNRSYYISNSSGASGNGQYYSAARSLRTDHGLLFKFSIYNYYSDTEDIELGLLINPSDIQLGQSFIASNSYTRQSWITSLWGSQQQTIACSGTSAAFYIGTNVKHQGKIFNDGLTTINRKETLGFINLLSLIGLYKNNGSYFLDGDRNVSLFSKDKSRVINVMDSVLLSYDGSEYVGSFNSFTLDEDPSKPFSLRFNFEFVVSCMRGDAMDGHLRMKDNENRDSTDEQIPISVQGYNQELTKTVTMSPAELNKTFKISGIDKGENFMSFQEHSNITDIKTLSGEPTKKSSVIIPSGNQDGVGDKRTKTYKSGATIDYYQVAGDGSKLRDIDGNEILDNLENVDERAFGTKRLDTVVMLYAQESAKGGMTYAEFIEKAKGNLNFDLDPVVFSTILTVEPYTYLATKYDENGKPYAYASPDAKGDYDKKTGTYKSYGITQVHENTFNGLAKDPAFKTYMKDMGYNEIKHENCKTDATYSIATSVYLLSKNSKSSLVGDDPVKQIIAYNAGAGKMNGKELPEATIRYLKTYQKIAGSSSKTTAISNSGLT